MYFEANNLVKAFDTVKVDISFVAAVNLLCCD